MSRTVRKAAHWAYGEYWIGKDYNKHTPSLVKSTDGYPYTDSVEGKKQLKREVAKHRRREGKKIIKEWD